MVAYFFSPNISDIIDVRTFGATGDGSTDDRAAIQTAFDTAFGPAASPHGNTNRFQNRPVYFPAGDYRIGGPLYLTNVMSGWIFGAGQNSARLQYTGAYSGNTVAPATGGANAITPLIMTNGLAYSRIEGINLAMGGAVNNCVGLYLFQDGTQGTVTQNHFKDILIESTTAGVLIGYESNALCSEQNFDNCSSSLATYGFRNISSNALNNKFHGCSAAQCDVGFSCPTGSISILSGSLAENAVDITLGQHPMMILATRTESANFVDFSASGQTATIISCVQASGAGPGYFVNLANSGAAAIIDGCVQESIEADEGLISGVAGSKVYKRSSDFRNTNYIAAFGGTVVQNI